MGYGDSLCTWLARFGSGMTLTAYNANGGVASFGKKDVSFTLNGLSYKYGGIGVDATGARDAETDFVSATKAEHIEATFATPLTKATVGVAALFGGSHSPYDAPYTEQLSWKAYNAAGTLIGSGQVAGTPTGLAQFTIEIAGQTIKKIVLTPSEAQRVPRRRCGSPPRSR
jgi:hypothetical protein